MPSFRICGLPVGLSPSLCFMIALFGALLCSSAAHAGEPKVLVYPGDTVPGLGTVSFLDGPPIVAPNGRIAFRTNLRFALENELGAYDGVSGVFVPGPRELLGWDGVGAITFRAGNDIYRRDPTVIPPTTLLVEDEGSAPGFELVSGDVQLGWEDNTFPDVNPSGDLAFSSFLRATDGTVDTDEVIWSYSVAGSALTGWAREGDPYPWMSTRMRFARSTLPLVDGSGAIYFLPADGSGFGVVSNGGGSLGRAIGNGTPVPELGPSARVSSVGSVDVNDAGELAVSATLSGGVSGWSVLTQRPGEPPRVRLREGDVIFNNGIALVRVVESVERVAISDDGHVAVLVRQGPVQFGNFPNYALLLVSPDNSVRLLIAGPGFRFPSFSGSFVEPFLVPQTDFQIGPAGDVLALVGMTRDGTSTEAIFHFDTEGRLTNVAERFELIDVPGVGEAEIMSLRLNGYEAGLRHRKNLDGGGRVVFNANLRPVGVGGSGGFSLLERQALVRTTVSAVEGGTIIVDDGAVSLDFDPGDLASDTVITANPLEDEVGSSDGSTQVGNFPGRVVAAVALDPDGIRFDQPVTLTFEVDVSDLSEFERLTLAVFRRTQGSFGPPTIETLDSTCATNEAEPGVFIATCTAEIDGFSDFAVASETRAVPILNGAGLLGLACLIATLGARASSRRSH